MGDRAAGITPARAGKRSDGSKCPVKCWDHPRACGEKRPLLIHRSHSRGSPPRVRGKGQVNNQPPERVGITPARAGKSCGNRRRVRRKRDHPRACGEKHSRPSGGVVGPGSPPRVRGKVRPRKPRPTPRGITPARAGKRSRLSSTSSKGRDHPRACGEKSDRVSLAPHRAGSPPRVRGKGRRAPDPRKQVGITPARAGKSWRPYP